MSKPLGPQAFPQSAIVVTLVGLQGVTMGYTVKKPRVIIALMCFISALMSHKRERENFEALQTVL